MEWLPLPKTWRGWVAALALVAIAFTAYYLVFFSHLLKFYEQVLYSLADKNEGLVVKVAGPRYVSSFGNRWIHVVMLNAGKETLQDVRVWLASEGPKDDVDRGAWPGFVGVPSLLKSPPGGELHFTKINSGETVWGRLPVYATDSFTGYVKVQVPQAQKTLEVGELGFERSRARFLAHVFVENILLPPWSNGLLLGLSVFVGYLAERRKEELDDVRKEEHGPGREAKDPKRIALLVLEGLRGLTLFFTIVFAFSALPWCCSGENLLLLILFLVLLAAVFYIGPRLERRLKSQDGQGAQGSGRNTDQSGRWSGLSKFAKGQGLWGGIRRYGAELMTLGLVGTLFFWVLYKHKDASTAPLIGLAAGNFLVWRIFNVLSKGLTQGPRRSTKRPSRGKRTSRTSSRRWRYEQRIQ